MSILPRRVEAEIHNKARFYYVNMPMRRAWNDNRREGELRMLCGWIWVERRGAKRSRGGFNTPYAAMCDAYYSVVVGAPFGPTHARHMTLTPKLPDDENGSGK
jgi:hypothetical protein